VDVTEFLGIEWLKDSTADSGIRASREGVAAHWGWDGGWYSSEDRRTELFNYLNDDAELLTQSGRARKNLLDDITSVSGDQDCADWISVVEREAFWSVPGNRYGAAEWSGEYGMNYRYDQLCEIYEWEHPDEPEVWMSQEDADARIAAAAEQHELESEYSDPVWDENWDMLYRINPSGVYEYAYSDDQVTVRAGTGWLSYAEMMQDASESATVPPSGEAQEPIPLEVQERESVVISYAAEAFAGDELPPDVKDALGILTPEQIQEVLEEELGLV
jgi:hypothetical protein